MYKAYKGDAARLKMGPVTGFIMIIPRRDGPGFRVVTGEPGIQYADLDEFVIAQIYRNRMPARQIARIPLVAEVQTSADGQEHVIVYTPHHKWGSLRGVISDSLHLGSAPVWHPKEF